MTNKKLLLLTLASIIALPVIAQKKSFEGEIEFTNTITVDKTLRTLYKYIQNGEYKTSCLRKGQDEKSVDTYFGITSVVLKSKRVGYVWSDLLKKGYRYNYNKHEEYLAKANEGKQRNTKPTGKMKMIHGYLCREYKGTDTKTNDLFGVPMTNVVQYSYWVCLDYPDEYISATHLEGMPFYFEERGTVSMPLIGEGAQHQVLEITRIKERKVSAEELAIPKDVEFKEVSDGYQAQQKIAKDIRKYKKKNKISDNGVKTEGVSREQGEWDF